MKKLIQISLIVMLVLVSLQTLDGIPELGRSRNTALE
jgi:hypothetical protein